MCWNEKVSLNTFVFGLFAILFSLQNEIIDKKSALFYFSVIVIQLMEYFTWKNINDKNKNKLFSKIILAVLFFQVVLFINKYFEDPVKSKLYMLYTVLILFAILISKIDFSMSKASNGHLSWDFIKMPIAIVYILFMLGILYHIKDYKMFLINVIIISSVLYTYYKTNTWGSLWCWIGNLISVVLIYKVFYKEICKLKK